MRLLQFGQWDGGVTIDSFTGTRSPTTLKKEPNMRPNKNNVEM